MRRLYCLLFCVLAVSSCIDNIADAIGNGMASFGKGNSEISWGGLGYIDKDTDLSQYTSKVKNLGKIVDYTIVPLVAFTDSASVAEAGKYFGGTFDERSALNEIDMNEWRHNGMPIVFQCFPFTAKVDEVVVESDDPEMLRVESGETVCNFTLVPLKMGDVKLRLRVKGLNTIEKVYIMRITATLKLCCYVDQFWNNARLSTVKYKVESMPASVGKMHLNVQDSVVVIGGAYGLDELHGMTDFGYKYDTTTFRTRQHTDTYRFGRRILLRDVSVPVDWYNWWKFDTFYMRVGPELAKNYFSSLGMDAIKMTLGNDGSYWLVLYEGSPYERRMRLGIYSLATISRTLYFCKVWPFDPKIVVRANDKGELGCYVEYLEPYSVRQIKLFLSVLCDNPYIKFNVKVKNSMFAMMQKEDDVDESLDFEDETNVVVDSLGTTLGQYFWVSFMENMTIRQRDSLALELERLTREVQDSTKWLLDYDPDWEGLIL